MQCEILDLFLCAFVYSKILSTIAACPPGGQKKMVIEDSSVTALLLLFPGHGRECSRGPGAPAT